MDDLLDLSKATALVVTLLPQHVGDQAMALEMMATLLLGEVRAERPIGVGTPTEDLWRDFGVKGGVFLSEVRYRLTGEVPDGVVASGGD
jgi:hypothetical protein